MSDYIKHEKRSLNVTCMTFRAINSFPSSFLDFSDGFRPLISKYMTFSMKSHVFVF